MAVALPVVVGAGLVAGFVWHARRRADALIDIHLLGRRAVAAACTVLFLSNAALTGAMFLLPLFRQVLRGYDALGAGLLLISQGLGTLISRFVAGRLTDRFGARPVALSGFIVVAGATSPG